MPWMTDHMIRGSWPKLKFGVGCKIDGEAVLIGDNIELGDNVRIDMGAKLLAGGKDASIRIGSHVHIATDAILMGAGGIAIHDHCCVGMKSILCSATDDFSGQYLVGPQYNDPTRISEGYTAVFKAKIVMHEFSIVTTACLLLPGVEMDEGSVLAAGAMVPKGTRLSAWTIWGGTPLRTLKPRASMLRSVAGQWEKRWILIRDGILKANSSPHPDTAATGSSETP